MTYRGWRILETERSLVFREVDGEPGAGREVEDISWQTMGEERWFSVIDKQGFVAQSFDTIEECKQFIDEEED